MNEQKPWPMPTNPRRRKLVIATSAVGGVAAVGTAIPFILSMSPSERGAARARPWITCCRSALDGVHQTGTASGRPLQIVAGVVMVLMGLAMVTGKLTKFSYWLLERFPILGQIGRRIMQAALRGGLRHRGGRGNDGRLQDAGRDECSPSGDERRVRGERSAWILGMRMEATL